MSLSVVVVVDVAATAAAFTQRRAAVGGERSSSHVAAVGGEIDVILVIPITVDAYTAHVAGLWIKGGVPGTGVPPRPSSAAGPTPLGRPAIFAPGGLGKLRATFLQRSLYSGRPSLPLQRESCWYRRQTATFGELLHQGNVSLVLRSWSPPSFALPRARLVALQLRRGG